MYYVVPDDDMTGLLTINVNGMERFAVCIDNWSSQMADFACRWVTVLNNIIIQILIIVISLMEEATKAKFKYYIEWITNA